MICIFTCTLYQKYYVCAFCMKYDSSDWPHEPRFFWKLRIAMTHPDPLDPFKEYLPSFLLECGQFSPNVGKHSSPMDPMGAVTFEWWLPFCFLASRFAPIKLPLNTCRRWDLWLPNYVILLHTPRAEDSSLGRHDMFGILIIPYQTYHMMSWLKLFMSFFDQIKHQKNDGER